MASSKEAQAILIQAEQIRKKDADSYIRLRESLDALRDASLVHYGLIGNVDERKRFSDQITEGIVGIFEKVINTGSNITMWENRKEAFDDRVAAATSNCPPGFMDVDGRCIRIGNPLMSKK